MRFEKSSVLNVETLMLEILNKIGQMNIPRTNNGSSIRAINEPLYLWRNLHIEFEYANTEFAICRWRQICQGSLMTPIRIFVANVRHRKWTNTYYMLLMKRFPLNPLLIF